MKVYGIERETIEANPFGEEWLVKDGKPVNGLDRQDVMAIQKELKLGQAPLSHTMGPHWRRIYWINNRCLSSRL
jgi:hypothetical protein